MKVEELIIDGFKSYATRTVISGWDPLFNAITGLNGSGKSNILDAICFVLGIASMSTVRASNLQDLIYKRGQAGVTKASVTIVFDNLDKEKSPIGFETSNKISVTRQVILGGTCKYLVNGHKAQQQTVLNLFQSVQLNINNPNFLIMQGKITKVLNMKPPEILSLIEEAAGTRTFEDRKEKALRTMAKKEAKLVEIRNLLKEEIEPKLERLRSEKRTFLEYQKIQTDLEKLSRVIACHNYKRFSEQFHHYSTIRAQHEDTMQDLNDKVARLEGEIANLTSDLEEVKKQKESELAKGGKIELIAIQETKINDNLTRLVTSHELTMDNLKEEKARFESLTAQLQDLELQIANNLELYASLETKYEETKLRFKNLKDEYNKKEELLTTLSTGVTSKGGTDGGYTYQLKQSKENLSMCRNDIKQSTLRILHLEDQVKSDLNRLEQAKAENEIILHEIKEYEHKISSEETKFKEFGFDPRVFNELRDQESMMRKQLEEYQYQLNNMRRDVGNIDFHYSKPSPQFGPESVKGVALQLFSISENQEDKALALQVCAGGRLYNVVVDNANTASALLERGNLKRRVTIIPLDKINGRSVPNDKVLYAKDKCPGKVELALNLIDFNQELMRAMTFIFGTTFICTDPQSAKEITFDPRIRARSITLEGDIYDPEGNLSGGSRKNTSSILVKMQLYNALTAKIEELKGKHSLICNELDRLDELNRKTKALQNDLNLSKHELSLLQRKYENSPASMLIKEYEKNAGEIEKLRSHIVEQEQRSQALEGEIATISKDIEEFNQDKGSKLKALEKELKVLKKEMAAEDAKLRSSDDSFRGIQIEVEQQKTEAVTLKENIEASTKAQAESTHSLEASKKEIQKLDLDLAQVRAELEDERAKLIGFNDEINELNNLLADKNEDMNQAKLTVQKLQHDLEKSEGATKTLRMRLDELIEENDWITEEQVCNSIIAQYPNIDIEEYEGQAAVLAERFQHMKRKVNANIMSMIDNVEKKEAALIQMIRTIERDKAKIEHTIDKLNDYKRDTLNTTYRKVSDDFGNIFADLLPGSFAKLVPLSAADVTQGLEVKVKLGTVWKESLVELSGGQRSLIALLLIMALLQFKPAPMYILDEVDAALDLSHTQNIGHLIKTRFKGLQFIVVSLKEGMFTNANRVFRTRFQDGTSMVSSM